MISLIFILIYFASVVIVGGRYAKKYITPGFWSILFLFTPILNTILAIKFFNLKDYKTHFKNLKTSFKEFKEEIEG